MRTVVYEEFGEPAEVLRVRDRPVPEPGPGEVRMRMLATPVNPSDLMAVRGRYTVLPELPATPGFEGVGIVESAGRGLLGRYLLGKRAAVLNRQRGNWCEQTVVPTKQVIPVPNDLPDEQAATFFINPATAYAVTRKVLAVPRNEWLLQTAAGSALGRMVIRLGRRFGFRTLNVVRRAEQVEELRQLGADEVVVFDSQRDDAQTLQRAISERTGEPGVRFAMDPVGGRTGSAVVGALAERGHMVVYGTLSGTPLSFSPRTLMAVAARIEGFWLARWMARQRLPGKLRLVRTLSKLVREGVLTSDVEATYPLEQVAEAVRAAEAPGRRGKILLRMAGDGAGSR